MNVQESPLKDCFVIKPKIFHDGRGFFYESYNEQKFAEETGLVVDFVQDNESFSTKGVLRGLHFQKGSFAQSKLVRVVFGEVLDVAVDLRKDSATYGKHFSILLSSENKKQLFVPRGFAHGFVVLSDTALFSYKCDNYYNKESESGLLYNDPSLNIDWQLKDKELIISDKDLVLPTLENISL
jgi:dTDP-4-dehydrorhamnose 3,5-epimerase